MQKTFNISENLINAVGAYLAEKPYKECAQLIHALQQEISQQVTPAEAKEVAEEVTEETQA